VSPRSNAKYNEGKAIAFRSNCERFQFRVIPENWTTGAAYRSLTLLEEQSNVPAVLKRASLSRSSGQWSDDDYDVLAHGEAVGRIFKANAAPVGLSWMWTLFTTRASQPTHGYEATREAAMTAFVKSWRLE
jgi:hypothetical protein